jgi:hypothetical protein
MRTYGRQLTQLRQSIVLNHPLSGKRLPSPNAAPKSTHIGSGTLGQGRHRPRRVILLWPDRLPGGGVATYLFGGSTW